MPARRGGIALIGRSARECACGPTRWRRCCRYFRIPPLPTPLLLLLLPPSANVLACEFSYSLFSSFVPRVGSTLTAVRLLIGCLYSRIRPSRTAFFPRYLGKCDDNNPWFEPSYFSYFIGMQYLCSDSVRTLDNS